MYCEIPEFIFALLIVAMKLLTLKQKFTSFLTVDLFCKFQMLIQTMAISDSEETLTTWGLEVMLTLSKMCNVLMNASIISEVVGTLVPSKMYRMLRILRYDFDWERQAS